MPIKKIHRGYRKTRYIPYKETLIDFKENFWAFIGSFVGIGIIAYLQSQTLPNADVVYLIGSFGASSVSSFMGLSRACPRQPRNLIGGHLVSAIVGLRVRKFLPDILWVTSLLAVSLSIVLMQITKTLHPPGGATSLIAVTGSAEIKQLGYWYVVSPVLSGALILLVVALVFNNLTMHRHYPNQQKHFALKKRIHSHFRKPEA